MSAVLYPKLLAGCFVYHYHVWPMTGRKVDARFFGSVVTPRDIRGYTEEDGEARHDEAEHVTLHAPKIILVDHHGEIDERSLNR